MQLLGLQLINVVLALLAAVAVALVLRNFVRARRAGGEHATRNLVIGVVIIAAVLTALAVGLLTVIQIIGG